MMTADRVNDEPSGDRSYNSLRFRLDSRLVMVLSAPNDDEAREGVAFCE